ncbi:MAG: gamma-glutamyl-gamma-aminobutyrate hydrolase family protein [Tannerella sp.]|nr:gamma-glutamyl-gamma-aminobutyrate hydrolase family protein [Tannerella sp.]
MKKLTTIILLACCIFAIEAQKRPVIGIADTYKDKTPSVPRTYVDAVLKAGGIPVVIPLMRDDSLLLDLLKSVDGVIFAGGGDFDPAYYHERPIPQMGSINAPRDTFEIRLVRLAAEKKVPVLGICRGMQLINVAFGGSLYQDIPAQYYDKSVSHRQKTPASEPSHSVIVMDSTIFSEMVGDKILMVNSAHHQAVKRLADGFTIAGKSADGLIEAMEKIDSANWILGVQFHPEQLVNKDKTLLKIFQNFVGEAGKPKEMEMKVEAEAKTEAEEKAEAEIEAKTEVEAEIEAKD